MTDRVYVVVDSRLSRGAQMAQSIHAVEELVAAYPMWAWEWKTGGNVIIVLESDDLFAALALIDPEGKHLVEDTLPEDEAEDAYFGIRTFHEPDFDDGLTAFAVFGDAADDPEVGNVGLVGHWLRELPLAGSKPRWPWTERKFQRWENRMRGSKPVRSVLYRDTADTKDKAPVYEDLP